MYQLLMHVLMVKLDACGWAVGETPLCWFNCAPFLTCQMSLLVYFICQPVGSQETNENVQDLPVNGVQPQEAGAAVEC